MTSNVAKSPLVGQILDSVTAYDLMKNTLRSLRGTDVWIISAYLKNEALKNLVSDLDASNQVSILVRWQPNDIISGASDVECYDFAKFRSWRFFARQDLHAKAFRFGTDSIYIGSANLTRKGFSLLGVNGNAEAVVQVEASPVNIDALRTLFDRAILVNDELEGAIRSWLESNINDITTSDGLASKDGWPLVAESLSSIDVGQRLMVSECFFTDASWLDMNKGDSNIQGAEIEHDISLLGFTMGMPSSDHRTIAIAAAIRQTKMFRWLEKLLGSEENGEMYFGRVTALLHDALLDDPRPYRHEVKTLVTNFFSWVKAVPQCSLIIDRPNYSERIRIVMW